MPVNPMQDAASFLGSASSGQQVPLGALSQLQVAQALEAQALNSFLQGTTAEAIRKLHAYLRANSEQHPQLQNCTPVVQQAAELFAAGDYGRAFSQIFQAYRLITLLRVQAPALPTP